MKVQLISGQELTDLTQGTDYTVTDRQLTLTNPTTLRIKIYRETLTTPLVGWADASVLRAADMTVQSTQLLHLAEETDDRVQDSGLAKDTTDDVWDARFSRIKNVMNPKDPQDAVTLEYITANRDSLINAVTTEGNTQVARVTAEGDKQVARVTSTGDTQNTRVTTTGNTQNTRVTDQGNTQNQRVIDTGDDYIERMTTLKDNASSSATAAANSAQEAHDVATQVGNPVSSVTESNGTVTVTKVNGQSNTFHSGLNILARNKAYAAGDIAYSPNLPSWAYLECVTAGTTGDTEPDFSTVTGG